MKLNDCFYDKFPRLNVMYSMKWLTKVFSFYTFCNKKKCFSTLCTISEAEHKKQNIFQRALGGGGDKSYHSNSKMKVRNSLSLSQQI